MRIRVTVLHPAGRKFRAIFVCFLIAGAFHTCTLIPGPAAVAAVPGGLLNLPAGDFDVIDAASAGPVTVVARMQAPASFGDDALPVLGLFQDEEGGSGLALYLSSETAGWFPVWKLWLRSPRGWIAPDGLRVAYEGPGRSAGDSSGGTSGIVAFDLATIVPGTGMNHIEAALSYSPDGYLYVAVRSLSASSERELFSIVLDAPIPPEPLHPAVLDREAAAGRWGGAVQLTAAEVTAAYAGKRLTHAFTQQFMWWLVVDPLNSDPLPVSSTRVFAGDAIGVRLAWPEKSAPGRVRLLAVQGDEAVELGSYSWRPGIQTALIAGPLPPGETRFRLEYVDGDYAESLGEKGVHVMPWQRIPEADLLLLRPGDFADEELFLPHHSAISELHMPYHLAHFHRVANAVREDGFIDISVWRNQADNAPYNARVMENILSLAYFYAVDRPWNPYYGSPALRERLEAALRFWVGMQSPDGRFSEYGAGRWNLAATAFATKFMGETLLLLHGGPPVDEELLASVVRAQRNAIMVTLTDPALYRHGMQFSNQFGNVWPAVLAYLKIFPDPEMEQAFLKRVADAGRDFQSPAGFYYEAESVDWSYNMGTHRSNMRMAWHYGREDGREHESIAAFLESERRWYEWLSYNAVREPDGSAFLINSAIESRQHTGSFRRLDSELAEAIPLARAFATTAEEREEAIRRYRAELEQSWPAVRPLSVGAFEAYSPYTFLIQAVRPWHPSEAERAEATALLPYLASDRFTHQRADSRHPLVLTYVRRPRYYAAFNAGAKQRDQQRFGLGLVWHPEAGGLLKSQSRSNTAAWGTKAAGQPLVYEASIPSAAYEVAGAAWMPRPGASDLPLGDVTIRYPLLARGTKTVTFHDDAIEVRVEHEGAFTEYIPLLVAPEDRLRIEDGRAVLTRGDVSVAVEILEGVAAMRTLPPGERVGRYQIVTLVLDAGGTLGYRLAIGSESPR